MKRSRFNEEQIIGILREGDGESSVKTICAKHNISEATYYAWKKKYGGMDVAEARRLRALGLGRSTFYCVAGESMESRRVHKEIVELSRKHPRYGYRRITALLRRDGFEVNAKRVQRIRREEGLGVSKRQRRMKRLGVSTAERQRAGAVNEVWSWDFVEDQTENGTRFRILTLIDEFTRRCLAVHVAWSIRAVDVITVVEMAIERYGRPRHLRSDNGPEFIAYAIQDWLKGIGIKTIYIKPGSPWENGHIESFHDKLRDECLNRELFGSLLEAQIILEQWRNEYNDQRPHSSIGYQTPSEYARSASDIGLQSASCLLASNIATSRKQTNNIPAALSL